MRFKRLTKKEWTRDLKQWKRKFAWFPICKNNEWVWLEYYERRAKKISWEKELSDDYGNWVPIEWEYRII